MKGFFAFQPAIALTCPKTDAGPPFDQAEETIISNATIYQTPTPCAPAEWPYAAVCFLLDSIKGV